MAGGTTITTTGVLYINGKQVENTFDNLRRVTNTLERDIRKLTPGTQEFIDASQKLTQSRQRFQELKNEINGTRKAVQEATNTGNSFKAIFTGNIAADFFMNGLNAAKQFGVEIKENVEELVKIKTTLSQLDSDLNGGALSKAASTVKSIADTYGKSVDEIQLAVKGLNVQTGDTNKSLSLIKQGFEAGADASGEMLTQLKEYPSIMKDVKLSAEETVALIAQTEKLGVYDDKGIDAIKEGMLRLRDEQKATKDSLTSLGLDSTKIYKDIAAGTTTYFDVLKLVSAKITEMGPNSRITGAAISAIFGGPGEDAGYRYLSQLKDINLNLNELTDSVDENVIAKRKELEANEKLNAVWVELTGTASFLNQMYSSLKSGMADLLSATFGIKNAKLSEEYLKQSTRLEMLNMRLGASNLSYTEKLKIYSQLRTEFPQYFKNLDLEKMKHNEIALAIRNASNEMRKKYQLQALQETVDEKGGGFKDASTKVNTSTRVAEDTILRTLEKIPALKNLKLNNGTTGETVAMFLNYLEKNKDIEGNSLIIRGDLRNALGSLNRTIAEKNKAFSDLNKEIKFKEKQTQALGLGDVKLDDAPLPSGASKDVSFSGNAEADKAAKKAQKEAEAARKKADAEAKKANEQRKKDLDESYKLQAEANNRSIEAEIQLSIDTVKLQEDSYNKEKELADLERSKEFNSQREQQDKILANIADFEKKKSEAKSPEAITNLQNSLANERSLLETHDQIILVSEQAHQMKLKAIKEKWDTIKFQKDAENSQRKIEETRRQDEEDIIAISTLSEAKEKLADAEYLKLTDTELSNIRTLEDAKAALREEANRKMLAAQLVALEEQQKILQEQLKGMTGPAAEKLKEDLDTLRQKITSVKSAIDGGNTDDAKKVTEENDNQKESVDILGFSAKQWEESFNNLDTTAGKLKAAQMGVQALSNAFQAYSNLQSALNEKEMAKFDKNQTKKKKDLLQQLNEGLINQEEYQKGVQLLEAQTEYKKAELAYKQAKIQRKVQIASAIANTALGVIGALSMQPWTWANIAAASLVGIMGGVQVATIASQPLPEMPSFDKGGFTGNGFGSPDASGYKPAGIVHAKEWVAPEWMTEDPKTANVINYLESVRVGKTKGYATGGFANDESTVVSQSQPTATSDINADYVATLKSVQDLLQYLKDNGIEAWMIEDAENGKKIKRAIKKFETIENAASRK